MFEGPHAPPFYNDLYAFSDGAQNDIFVNSVLPQMDWEGSPVTGKLTQLSGTFNLPSSIDPQSQSSSDSNPSPPASALKSSSPDKSTSKSSSHDSSTDSKKSDGKKKDDKKKDSKKKDDKKKDSKKTRRSIFDNLVSHRQQSRRRHH